MGGKQLMMRPLVFTARGLLPIIVRRSNSRVAISIPTALPRLEEHSASGKM